jgi:peptidyl-prolyl cis-trans isomerase C
MTTITVNGVEIDEQTIAAEVQNHPASTMFEARAEAAQALAIRELLLQEARRQGIAPDPEQVEPGKRETDDDSLIRQLLETELHVPEPDEDACRRYFDNNRSKFRTPPVYRAAHILLPAAPDDDDARRNADTRARELIAAIQAAPDRFAELARDHSACPSATDGGDLGRISRGQTAPELESFLDALEPGQLCPTPVATRYGVHVLRLDDRQDGEQLAFEEVRERIAAYLTAQTWNRAAAQYIRILAAQSDIRGVDLDAAQSPLVQ